MFTLIALYLTAYLLIILSIFKLTFSQLPSNIITTFSLNNFILFIQKYKNFKNLYLWLFFCLTGLPPVGLFFIKFNILFFIFSNTHIFSIIVIFFFFFLNMLFYTQIFAFKNQKKSMYHLINVDIFTFFKNTEYRSSNFSSYIDYKIVLFTVNILFLLFFTFIFFSDYYLIFYILIVNNKSKNLIAI